MYTDDESTKNKKRVSPCGVSEEKIVDCKLKITASAIADGLVHSGRDKNVVRPAAK